MRTRPLQNQAGVAFVVGVILSILFVFTLVLVRIPARVSAAPCSISRGCPVGDGISISCAEVYTCIQRSTCHCRLILCSRQRLGVEVTWYDRCFNTVRQSFACCTGEEEL